MEKGQRAREATQNCLGVSCRPPYLSLLFVSKQEAYRDLSNVIGQVFIFYSKMLTQIYRKITIK